MCGLVYLQLTRHFTRTHLTFYKFPIAVNFNPANSRSNCCVQNKIDWFNSVFLFHVLCSKVTFKSVSDNRFVKKNSLYVTGVKIPMSEHQIIVR